MDEFVGRHIFGSSVPGHVQEAALGTQPAMGAHPERHPHGKFVLFKKSPYGGPVDIFRNEFFCDDIGLNRFFGHAYNGKRFFGVAVDAQTGATLAFGFPDLCVAAQAHLVKNRLQLAIGPGVVAGGALGCRRPVLKLGWIQYVFFVLVPVMAVQTIEAVHVVSM
jgi:hypothetical protein